MLSQNRLMIHHITYLIKTILQIILTDTLMDIKVKWDTQNKNLIKEHSPTASKEVKVLSQNSYRIIQNAAVISILSC